MSKGEVVKVVGGAKKAKAVVMAHDEAVMDIESDVAITESVRRRGPGRVDVAGHLVLHTPQADELFTGKRSAVQGDKNLSSKSYMGLIGFAGKTMHIWTAAREDDPYADLLLIRIEEEYDELVKLVESTQQHVNALLESLDGIEMNPAVNVAPVAHELKFICPWAYRAASLLSRYDRLVLDGVTCRRVGLVFGDDWFKTIVEPARRMRRWFSLSKQWVNTGVKRSNIVAGDGVATRAAEIYKSKFPGMLNLPEAVLFGQRRARVSPMIVVPELLTAGA